MYVCLCNALTDTQVRDAACKGACRPSEVQAHCGCRAQCGTCARAMLAMLRDLPATALAGYAAQMERPA
ncbi:bacterioferritin-associated ferredoxin [Humitalea rosea]|uniref:Bacterioferritin-associated ferredoxin n=1 Tax=Humitalea rosea TaxID=990373 RepID=A0A2W7JRT5_9PROT|nr:(2Fe-2S)-binding protein [Humitalea rosea]PZW37656.1 bacterioferritin-associated ferredoxin [Humitalea rosea]